MPRFSVSRSEHRFTIPQIAQFLSERHLVFLGFDLAPTIEEQYAGDFSTQ